MDRRFKFVAQKAGATRIDVNMGINMFDAEFFVMDLQEIEGDVEVVIDSPGGSVFAALKMFDALKAFKGKVTTKVQGVAFSAATIILAAGDIRIATENSFGLIHGARIMQDFGDEVTEQSAEKIAEELGKINDTMGNIYAKILNMSKSEILSFFTEEKLLTAKDMKKIGLINKITDKVVIEALYDLQASCDEYKYVAFKEVDAAFKLINEKNSNMADDTKISEDGIVAKLFQKLVGKSQAEPVENTTNVKEYVANQIELAEINAEGKYMNQLKEAQAYRNSIQDKFGTTEVDKIENSFNEKLAEKSNEITEKDTVIASKDEEIAKLQAIVDKSNGTSTEIIPGSDPILNEPKASATPVGDMIFNTLKLNR